MDAGGCITAPRQTTAMFEWSKRICRVRSTRRTKRHVHLLRMFVVTARKLEAKKHLDGDGAWPWSVVQHTWYERPTLATPGRNHHQELS